MHHFVSHVCPIATYVGEFELGDDDFLQPEDPDAVLAPSAGPSVVAGLLGYTMGPLMLVYGFKVSLCFCVSMFHSRSLHQIKEFIVVINALIANGIDSFMESLAYLEHANAEASGGKILPSQL